MFRLFRILTSEVLGFVFFLYLLLSASWNENDLPLYISDIRQILRYRTSLFIQPFPHSIFIFFIGQRFIAQMCVSKK
jgi:hypothetical protein